MREPRYPKKEPTGHQQSSWQKCTQCGKLCDPLSFYFMSYDNILCLQCAADVGEDYSFDWDKESEHK